MTPTPSFKVTVKFKGEYLANGASDPLYVWFYARVFGVGGSNDAVSGSLCNGAVARNPCDSWTFLLGLTVERRYENLYSPEKNC